jgi:FkbM family methyltransferase
MLNRLKTLLRQPTTRTDSSATAADPAPSPTRTFTEFFDHVKAQGFVPKTVLDIGVARGTPPLYSAFPNAYFVLVEPVEDFIPDLKKIVSRYRGEYHVCALMAKPGHSTILKSKDLHGSSMMHRLADTDNRLQDVEINTLDGLVGDRDLEQPVLLKTDCQGGDFDVVKGGEKTLERCDLVILEVSLFKFWGAHHPDPLDILNYMSDRGFVIYDFLDGLFRPFDNALGQIDIVFVRRDGMFRQSHSWVKR